MQSKDASRRGERRSALEHTDPTSQPQAPEYRPLRAKLTGWRRTAMLKCIGAAGAGLALLTAGGCDIPEGQADALINAIQDVAVLAVNQFMNTLLTQAVLG